MSNIENNSAFRSVKTVNDISNSIIQYLKNGIVTVEHEEFTYASASSEYTLQSDGVTDSIAVLAIISIEGMNDDGNWIPPTGSFNSVSALVEGTDYILVRDSSLTIPETGDELYSRIQFQNSNVFEDGTTFYVSYSYYDVNRGGSITNFNDGSVALMLVKSFAQSIANLYSETERVYKSGYVTEAYGSDLDKHAQVWGLTRLAESFAVGKVKVSNDQTVDDITLNASSAIVSIGGNASLIFKPTVGGTVSAKVLEGDPANIGWFDVQAVETGFKYNVGANSISAIYTDTTLAVALTTADITVTNPTTVSGVSNLFSGGSNDESDEQLRARIIKQADSLSRGTLPAIKAALELLSIVDNVKLQDWSNNLSLTTGEFFISPVSFVGIKTLADSSSVATMVATVDEYKPASIRYTLIHPIPNMLQLSGVITIDDDQFDNAIAIQSGVESKITDYVQELSVGDDVILSEIIYLAKTVKGVYDFVLNQLDYTEFATQPPAYDTLTEEIIEFYSGTASPGVYVEYYQEVKFMTLGVYDHFTWVEDNPQTLSHSGLVTTYSSPSVYLAIQDESGNWVRDPAFSTDFYSGSSTSTITIDETAGSGVGITLVSGTSELIYQYEYHGTDTIDGLRVKLNGVYISGSTSGTVDIFLTSGATPTKIAGASGTITVLSGVNDYEVMFGSPVTVADVTETYKILYSGVTLPSSGSSITLPVSASGTRGFVGTSFYEWSGAAWVRVPNTTTLAHTIITT